MIEFLMVPGAPKPVAPYSHATSVDGRVFVTGQVPTDPNDNSAPLPDGIEGQTHRVFENLGRVLAGIGSGLDQVVFARVYLTRFERDYAPMNAVYQSYFVLGRCRHAPVFASPVWRSARLWRSICWHARRRSDAVSLVACYNDMPPSSSMVCPVI
jgi:2-iminobutanoate/2-iminopropanoate deaminase